MEKILVVEDDQHINEVVREYLKESGFRVLSAFSGDEAMSLIQNRERIGLFVLDIMLPGCSGLELLSAIRADEVYCQTPVLMLTALNDEPTQLASFDNLADDYMSKPFSPKILVKRVQALLRRTGASPQQDDLISVGNLRIYTERYEVFEGNQKIILTLKEFELLRILTKNRQKVLSRQQLLDLAWGYDYFGDERIVDVHIKNLQKKLKSDIIVTVKGVGYKID